MFRRAFGLVLLLVLAELASGCCYCHRPFFFRRWNAGCCGTSVSGASCCGEAAPFQADYGPPPVVPGAPAGTMPQATPLTRR